MTLIFNVRNVCKFSGQAPQAPNQPGRQPTGQETGRHAGQDCRRRAESSPWGQLATAPVRPRPHSGVRAREGSILVSGQVVHPLPRVRKQRGARWGSNPVERAPKFPQRVPGPLGVEKAIGKVRPPTNYLQECLCAVGGNRKDRLKPKQRKASHSRIKLFRINQGQARHSSIILTLSTKGPTSSITKVTPLVKRRRCSSYWRPSPSTLK